MLTNKPKHFYNPSAVIIRVSNCHMLSSLCVKVQLQHVRDYKSFIEENFLHNIDPQIIKSFIIVVIQLLLFLLRWFRAAADKHTKAVCLPLTITWLVVDIAANRGKSQNTLL